MLAARIEPAAGSAKAVGGGTENLSGPIPGAIRRRTGGRTNQRKGRSVTLLRQACRTNGQGRRSEERDNSRTRICFREGSWSKFKQDCQRRQLGPHSARLEV